MLFNSIKFAVFFVVVFIFYWLIDNKKTKYQNILLLIASYVFYSCWDWHFLLLLILISLTNYGIGLSIDKIEFYKIRRALFTAGLIVNLGVLAVFKYFNFFIDSFVGLVSMTGYDLPRSSLRIILPLGISFYVFLGLSYIIDIYRKSYHAHTNIVNVLLTLSFFPIILAGPIQRPSSLLPQIIKKREFNFNKAADGLRQILWGLFAKVVLADNLAVYVDVFFDDHSAFSGSTLLLGAIFYSVQIYADFSGYSNIAIGIAKLLGFSLMKNFAFPYFSQDVVEFWKRWHISLTLWFRDYVFLPLSFKISHRLIDTKVLFIRVDLFIYTVASMVTWFLTGLWHGANYTFILWGMMHGFLLIVYHLQKNPRKRLFKRMGIIPNSRGIVLLEKIFTLSIIMMTWILFRSEDIGTAINYIKKLFSSSLFQLPYFEGMRRALYLVFITSIFFVLEWNGRKYQFAISQIGLNWKRPIRYAFYYVLIIIIYLFVGKEKQFIYFQF